MSGPLIFEGDPITFGGEQLLFGEGELIDVPIPRGRDYWFDGPGARLARKMAIRDLVVLTLSQQGIPGETARIAAGISPKPWDGIIHIGYYTDADETAILDYLDVQPDL